MNVFFGSASGLPATFSWRRFTSAATGGRFGQSLATADVNGDGTADILVGAPEATFGEPSEGAVLVWLGSQFLGNTPDGDASSADWFAQSNQGGARLGESVANAGDVDADSDDEILAGAPDFDGNLGGPLVDSGIAYMWYGAVNIASGADGTPGNAQWKMEIGVAGARLGGPRALLGGTTNWFEASVNLRSPAGRTTARLQLEAKPLGQALDGTSLLSSVYLDNVTFPRDMLNFLGSSNTPYAWRARVQSVSPLFGRSRWVSLPGNAARETDVHVIPEPGFAAGVVAGALALGWLHRRRRRRRA